MRIPRGAVFVAFLAGLLGPAAFSFGRDRRRRRGARHEQIRVNPPPTAPPPNKEQAARSPQARRNWLFALMGLLAAAGLLLWWRRSGRSAALPLPSGGLARLLVAALAGVGLTALLAVFVLPGAVRSVGESQLFLQAYTGLIGAALCIAAGFGLIGALTARVLPLAALGIPPGRGPYRVGIALAFAGGLLVIPALLLLVAGAVYRDGAPSLPLSWALPLGLLGALYGLVAGLGLGWVTVRARHLWRPALSGLVGGGLGGVVVGALLSVLPTETLLRSDWGRSGYGFIALAALIVGGVHLGWGLGLRRSLARLARHGSREVASGFQVTAFAVSALIILGTLAGLSRSLASFVTSRPADTRPLAIARPLSAPACPPPTDALERAIWKVSTQQGRPDLSCGNAVPPLIVMPGEHPSQPAGSAFDDVAALVEGAKREVLFTTMQWEPGDLDPGSTLTFALARLHARVVAEPEKYPGGMTVRLTLGNYPTVATFKWGDEVWDLMHDLLIAGVPLSDPAHGWRVEVGNYAGSFPHSHVKLVVIDGQTLLTAGFNYGYRHFPVTHPSGRGTGLIDLALLTRGPAAQDGLNIFDDLWTRSRVMNCVLPLTLENYRSACVLRGRGEASHPDAVKQAVPAGKARVFSLYRRAGFNQADDALVALLNASEKEIDLVHVNFSMNLPCVAALLNPALCGDDERLPFMTALIGALGRGVNVRLITSDGGLSGLENQIAIAYLKRQMRQRGIPASHFSARWSPLPLHAKGTLVDGRMLVIGSLNLHYSSWTSGLLGLNEAVAATSDPGQTQQFATLFNDFWNGSLPIALPDYLLQEKR